jgi:hypothetical protein
VARNIKKSRGPGRIELLTVLFLLGSALCFFLGISGLLRANETFTYAIQNLAFGLVLAVSAYGLYRGARRIWWLAIVLYILMGIAVSAYFAYEQGQIVSLVKIPIYLVILAYMLRPRVRNWFAV